MTAILNARDLPKEKMTKVRISVQLANLTRRFIRGVLTPLADAVDAVLQGRSRLRRPASAAATLPREWTTDECLR